MSVDRDPGVWVPDLESTGLLLIGFQNDFFAPDGALRPSIADPSTLDRTLERTVRLLQDLVPTPATIIASAICFSDGYTELSEPVGILAAIRDLNAFRADSYGSETVAPIHSFGRRIRHIRARHGFDAFFETDLLAVLEAAGVRDLLVAGALTSVCIDSTARNACERGFRVSVVRDCAVGRTEFEHGFYCDQIFPMYAEVVQSDALRLRAREEAVHAS